MIEKCYKLKGVVVNFTLRRFAKNVGLVAGSVLGNSHNFIGILLTFLHHVGDLVAFQ